MEGGWRTPGPSPGHVREDPWWRGPLGPTPPLLCRPRRLCAPAASPRTCGSAQGCPREPALSAAESLLLRVELDWPHRAARAGCWPWCGWHFRTSDCLGWG